MDGSTFLVGYNFSEPRTIYTTMAQISQNEVMSCLKNFEGYSSFKEFGRMHGFYKNAAIVFFVNTAEQIEAYFLMPYMDGVDYSSVYEFIRIAKSMLQSQIK